MSSRLLSSRFVTTVLVAVLVITVLSYGVYTNAQAEEIRTVMYLVPSERGVVESDFLPESLNAKQVLDIGYTTSWDTIRDLAAKGDLNALIIHHASVHQVRSDELEEMVRRQKVVVTGLGIPGDVLAEMIQMPGLFIWEKNSGYADTNDYFYTYSYALEGEPADLLYYLDDDGSSEPVKGANPVGVVGRSIRSTTDFIGDPEGVTRMLQVTAEHISDQNK